jgi:hypothetical protein
MAYVIRFARRREASRQPPAEEHAAQPRARFVLTGSGEPRLLAKGGLSSVYAGRLRVGPGRVRRVALKVFHCPMSAQTALATQQCIEALRRAGVRLPRVAMHLLSAGTWVQVSPLFGSLSRGSKFHQPALYYKALDAPQKAFAIDQLTRVVNAGYRPSLDLFVVFKDERSGIIPLDLDLIDPEPDLAERVRRLLLSIVQVGDDARERDQLLAVARAAALSHVRNELEQSLAREEWIRRYWTLE